MKISKLLPIVVAMALCTPAFAVGEVNSATSNYTLQLNEYLKITATDSGEETVEFGDDYVSASVNTGITGQFVVVNNNPAKTVYLEGHCTTSSANPVKALYGDDPAAMKLVFTNQTANYKAEDSAVTNITTGTTAVAENANAIAFPLVATSITNDIFPSYDSIGTATWDTTNNRAKYIITNGTTTFKFQVKGSNDASTFSTHDTMGTYKSTLTLTDVTP